MTPQLYRLDTQNQTLVWERSGENIFWRYWGKRLDISAMPENSIHDLRPTASFSLDDDFPLSVAPCFGNGWFNRPAILLTRGGRDFANLFNQCEVIENIDGIVFKFVDAISKFSVEYSFVKFNENVIKCKSKITNQSKEEIDLSYFASATLQIPPGPKKITYFGGRHNNEFQMRTDDLSTSIWLRENRRGLTSHDNMPASLVHEHADYDAGEVYGAMLAWSGNSSQLVEKLDGGDFQWQWGEWLASGEIKLQEGATYIAPELLISYSKDGFNGISQNFHRAVRQIVTWPNGKMRPRPIHINTWEGFYFDHNESALKSLVDEAAAVGIERFVLDDGWFKGRNDDTSALGDWVVDKEKYPNGLKPLAQYVLSKNMEFGLWVEPEMINPNSDLFRLHPDWAFQIEGRKSLTARNQLVLDLTKIEVRHYLTKAIGKLLAELPISYLKWDHNRDLTQIVGANGRAQYHNQIIAAYELFDAIRKNHPNVEIEACAGGGGRIDCGIAKYTHRFWTSDCIDALSRIEMQNGFLQFFPPELMGSHIGASPAHSTGRNQNFDFRAMVALQGHLGVELDVRKLSVDELSKLEKYNSLYKEYRDLAHQSVWRGQSQDNVYFQVQGNLDEFLLFIYRIKPTEQRFSPLIKLPFLKGSERYSVTQLAPTSSDIGRFSAQWLCQHGLNIPYLKAEDSLLLKLSRGSGPD